MAQMIDDTPVRMGYLIPVRNTQRVSVSIPYFRG